jgi:hypothetical protein
MLGFASSAPTYRSPTYRVDKQYREPPSNEAMIRHFHEHEAEFEQLTNDYYALIKQYYDTKKYPEPNEILKFKMAELGIRRVSAGGPSFIDSIYGNQPLQTLGMHLYLFDRGGSFAAYPDAEKATPMRQESRIKQRKSIIRFHISPIPANMP